MIRGILRVHYPRRRTAHLIVVYTRTELK